MNKNFCFMYEELPQPLSNKENLELLKLVPTGNSDAINKIVKYNIRLVFHVVQSKFNQTPIEEEELISAGFVGLMNAIRTFNAEENVYFSTYAYTCIRNAILTFIRDAKLSPTLSLDAPINDDEDTTFKDSLVDSTYDIEDIYEDKEAFKNILDCIQELDDVNRLIISLYFGINGTPYSQVEIAKMLNLKSSLISKKINDSLKKIKIRLVKKGYSKSSINFNHRKYVRVKD